LFSRACCSSPESQRALLGRSGSSRRTRKPTRTEGRPSTKNMKRQPASKPSAPSPYWISRVEMGEPTTVDTGTARKNSATTFARCTRGNQYVR
jgi:hypothetical protein